MICGGWSYNHILCSSHHRLYDLNGTLGASPLKRFLVDLYARKASLPEILGSREKYEELDMAFMVGITLAFWKMKREGSMYEGFEWWKERCR